MSLRYCPVGPWRATSDHLIIINGDRSQIYKRHLAPRGVRRLYERILDHTELECRPQLVWLRHAGGAGGFYLGNAIAIGAADMRAIARELANSDIGIRRIWSHGPYYLSPRYSLAELELEVIRCVLAHEVGHAVAYHSGTSQGVSSVRVELQADIAAGAIAESMGWDGDLQRQVFHLIGCLGPACTHPSPDARRKAYEFGRTL